MKRHHQAFLAVGLVMILFLVWRLERGYQAELRRRADLGQPLWPPKEMSLGELRRRATFKLVVPVRNVERYPLVKTQLNWLHETRSMLDAERTFPGRQAACVHVRLSGGYVAAVVQCKAPSTPRAGATDWNVYQAVAQGYFFGDAGVGTWFFAGTAGGTDYLIVSRAPAELLTELQACLGPDPGGPGQLPVER